MRLCIRRNIYETSSSSASALVMVTNSTDKHCAIDKNVTEVIRGCFSDNGDGRLVERVLCMGEGFFHGSYDNCESNVKPYIYRGL